MLKVLLIGRKDVTLAFRDRTALILMLVAPFALTLGLGAVSGRFSGTSNTGLANIPVTVVNEDDGPLGEELLGVLRSEALAELVAVRELADAAVARQEVDTDRAAAVILIPREFSQSVLSDQASVEALEAARLVLYANPVRPSSVGVVRTVVDEFVRRVDVGRVGARAIASHLVENGLVLPQGAAALGAEIAARLVTGGVGDSSITVRGVSGDAEAVRFDVLAYMAPGMALMFLMYTVSNGGRTLLAERAQGTLPRLLVTPTTMAQVLGGKLCGTYLTGVAQMLILIGASTLLFGLEWGDPLGVVVLVLAAVVGAVGWGVLLTALAKTPGQVSTAGSAMMLTFGILGGSFVNPDAMPRWFALLGKITPNSWGLDGFAVLAMGGGLEEIIPQVLALLAMGGALFAVAAIVAGRRRIDEQ